jgi:hypothetical protein
MAVVAEAIAADGTTSAEDPGIRLNDLCIGQGCLVLYPPQNMMRFLTLTIILLILRFFPTHAQNSLACVILVTSHTENDFHFTLFAPNGHEYAPIDTPIVNRDARFEQSNFFSGNIRLVIQENNDTLEIYTASMSGFEYWGRIPAHSSFTLSPRENNAWSPDGRFIALHNIMDSYIARLFIYDTLEHTFYAPTELTHVYHVSWSPSTNFIAYIAYDLSYDVETFHEKRNYALYVSRYDGETLSVIPVAEESFARFQWLSDDELILTTCVENTCQAEIHNIQTQQVKYLAIGNMLISGWIEVIDSFLLTSIEDRNLFLLNESGEIITLTQVDTVLSEPILSHDGQYISITVQDEGIYQLLILDILQQQVIARFALSGEIPTVLTNNRWDSFPYLYGFYYPFGEWHPHENSLLFVDNGTIYVYDVRSDNVEPIHLSDSNGSFFSPTWLCPT